MQKAIDEAKAEAKKAKGLEEELQKVKKSISTAPTAATTTMKETHPEPAKHADLDKVRPLLEGLSLYGRRERLPHAELCKRLKESIAPLLIENSLGKGALIKQLNEYLSTITVEKLQKNLPYYYILSEQA